MHAAKLTSLSSVTVYSRQIPCGRIQWIGKIPTAIRAIIIGSRPNVLR